MGILIPPQLVTYKQFMAVVIAQFVVLLPHISHLPPLYAGLGVLALIGLVWMGKRKKYAGFSPQPPKVVQYGIVLLGLAIILVTYRTVLGVDAGVAFLTLTLLGKLLELKQRRDAYIALTLSLFVIASLFLFEQSIFNAAMALLGIFAVFYALLQQNIRPDVLAHHSAQLQHHESGEISPKRDLIRPLARLFLQAIPLLVVLFIFFPRIPPLWSVPISESQGTTGMSNQMSPGNIARLSQSTELSFRVIDPNNNIRKNLPPRSQLYWRGLVLSRFDGVTWTPLNDYRADNSVWSGMQYQPQWFKQNLPANMPAGFNYQVILEPTRQNWLYGLDIPYSNTPGVGLTREFNLKSSREVYRRFSYHASKLNGLKTDVELPPWLKAANLQLPAGINPRSRQLAEQVFGQVRHDPRRYANYWLNWIRRENFVYTLEPPRLTGQQIDQFLFETRRGFCEHYSSAYTFLMRAVGIPARVVVGYQGGQFSLDQQSWEVRQLDAHAWVEIWLAGEGWVRVDPTAAVAPNRVELGMNNMVQQDRQLFGGGAFDQLRQNQFRFLNQLRTWTDYAGYLWQRDVVGFDQANQQSLLQRVLGIKSIWAQVLWMSGSFVLLIIVIVGWMWWRRRKIWHPLDAPLQRLSRKMQKYNLSRNEAEGIVDWLERLAQFPEFQQPAEQLIQLYQQGRYGAALSQTSQADYAKHMNKLVSSWPNKSK